jgi:hypothetical protein
MKPILVLGPARPGGGAVERWRIELHEVGPAESADAADYAAVVVVNDGGCGAAQRLLAACQMRDRQRGLRIGVLSYVGERGRPSPIGPEPRLSLELSPEEGARLEYQAV